MPRAASRWLARACCLGLLLAASLPWGTPALAGPPYLTDDPVPVDWHTWEIYLASLYQRLAGASSGALPLVEVNYGVAPEVELHSQAALETTYSGYGPAGEHGLSALELGVEWRVLTETDTRPQLSFYPTIEIPTGHHAAAASHAQLFLPVWAQKSVGRCTVYGGGGYWINPGSGNRNYAFTGVATEVEITERWSVGGELYYTSRSDQEDPGQGGFNLGATVDLTPRLELLASAGHTLSGTPTLTSYVGARIAF